MGSYKNVNRLHANKKKNQNQMKEAITYQGANDDTDHNLVKITTQLTFKQHQTRVKQKSNLEKLCKIKEKR